MKRMCLRGLRPLLIAVMVLTVLGAFAQSVLALQAYVIKRNSFNFDLWNIDSYGLVSFQLTSSLTYAADPVGVAIDDFPPWEATLFITSEFLNVIEFIDAATLQQHQVVTAPGASNLAGIAADGFNNIIYTVDRRTATIYAYDWDYTAQTLTLKPGFPRSLVNCVGAIGLALDELDGVLYVADGWGGYVRGYDVSTWSEVVSYSPPLAPVGIAVDSRRGLVYTTQPAGGCATCPDGNTLLCKHDLNTGSDSSVNMGHGGMGVAVDENTGYVYVTAGCTVDDISVWDTSQSPWVNIQQPPTGPLGDPAGIAIPNSSVPVYPFFVTKDDYQVCAQPGQTLTYDLCFDNLKNPSDDGVNVVLTDALPPELTFVSASDGGVYDPGAHEVVWDIGTLPAGAARSCVQLEAQVVSTFGAGDVLVNNAEITGGVATKIHKTTYNDTDQSCPCTTATTVELVSDPNPASAGALVTFTATVMAGGAPATGASGTMRFVVEEPGVDPVDVTVASGSAQWQTSWPEAGQHIIHAEYIGDGVTYCDSHSPGLTEIITEDVCGDGVCTGPENCSNCPEDCGPCPSDQCVYSQGYWKNHNSFAKNPSQQIPWPIDEGTMLCEQTWLEILQTPPKGGNAFYILGHQWIAAELNVANGAPTTPEVEAALADAEALLIGCEISREDRREALALASLLDDYNNGLVGPPKCGYCGDGEVQEDDGEQCDDGNNEDGDLCSCDCKRRTALCGQVTEPAGSPLALLLYLLPVAAILVHKKILR